MYANYATGAKFANTIDSGVCAMIASDQAYAGTTA
jgi:hypothetical protein